MTIQPPPQAAPAARDRLAALRGGLRLPLVAAPMFLVSGPDLVLAACAAGIGGAFPAPNARTIEALEDWLARVSAGHAALGAIAVSASANPLRQWYVYDYQISTTKLNDYPKFGVWPDGYYMSINQFNEDFLDWAGAGAVAFERDKMLDGLPAQMVYFDVGAVTLNFGNMLPSDLDGPPPPAGTPNYFSQWNDSSWLGDPQDNLRIWEFHVDWANPANSYFGATANYDPNALVPTSDVDPEICPHFYYCIPQPDCCLAGFHRRPLDVPLTVPEFRYLRDDGH